MTKDAICEEIKLNKLKYLVITDFNDNKLAVINESNSDRACKVLEDRLGNFSGYKRLIINGKREPAAKNVDSFTYELNLKTSDSSADTSSIKGPSSAIGAKDYVDMYTRMMDKQLDVQKELLELKLKQKQNDPSQWIPIMQMGMAFLRGDAIPATISGPTLTKGGVKEKKTDDEILEAMTAEFKLVQEKVSPDQYLTLLKNLNKITDLKEKMDKVNYLLEKIADKPQLLDAAVSFLG